MAGFPNPNTDGVKNGNGKRERSDLEDDPEFMPLSKRINNIHLSPERVLNGAVSNPVFSNPNLHRPSPSDHLVITASQMQINNVPDYNMGTAGRILTPNIVAVQYRPSLSQHANPHYYEANRALFHLYIERQMRNHQEPHPNVYGRPPDIDNSNNTL